MISYLVSMYINKLIQNGKNRQAADLSKRYLRFVNVYPECKPNPTSFDLQILLYLSTSLTMLSEIEQSLHTAQIGLEAAQKSNSNDQLAAFGEIISNRKLLQGKLLEAFEMNTTVLNITRNRLVNAESESDTFNTVMCKAQLIPIHHGRAWIYEVARQYDKAEIEALKAIEIGDELYDDDGMANTHNQLLLVRILRAQGKLAEAEDLSTSVYNFRKEKLPMEHIHVFDSCLDVGIIYTMQGKLDEADKLIDQAFKKAKLYSIGQHFPEFGHYKQWYGLLRLEQGKLGEAERLLTEAIGHFDESYSPDHPSTVDLHTYLVRLYEEKNMPDKVEFYNKKLEKLQEKIPELP